MKTYQKPISKSIKIQTKRLISLSDPNQQYDLYSDQEGLVKENQTSTNIWDNEW